MIDYSDDRHIDGLYPLVVSVQGHTVLVSLFQQALQKVLEDFTLDAVMKRGNFGGAEGITFLEWAFGFKVTEADLLGGSGAQYQEFRYNAPAIDLRAEGMALVKSKAIRKARERRERDNHVIATNMFPDLPPLKQVRPRRKRTGGE